MPKPLTNQQKKDREEGFIVFIYGILIFVLFLMFNGMTINPFNAYTFFYTLLILIMGINYRKALYDLDKKYKLKKVD